MLRCEMATSQMAQGTDRAVVPGQANRKKKKNNCKIEENQLILGLRQMFVKT